MKISALILVCLLLAIPYETKADATPQEVKQTEQLIQSDDEAIQLRKAPELGDVVTNSVGMKLTYVPPGEFMMGSLASAAETAAKSGGRNEWYVDEHPRHCVRITNGFYIGVTEVTQGQWEAVMHTSVRQQREKANPSWSLRGEGYNYPMYYVSWEEAVEFCRKLSQKENIYYRLPTETEWEYACRAGTTTPFNTGETISTDQANYNGIDKYGNSYNGLRSGKTMLVGSFRPNRFGLYDMHGNVDEWCNDWYDENYYGISSAGINPIGPSDGIVRCVRGGEWATLLRACRSATRGFHHPSIRRNKVGFRVVQASKPASEISDAMQVVTGSSNWVLALILSFILTWGIGLAPPVIIRYAILRKPLPKKGAIPIVILFWFVNIGIFTALGSQSKTHAALFLVAWVSYYILRRGYRSLSKLQS